MAETLKVRVDNHTSYVLEENGIDVALHFHLTVRCYPPRPEMAETAKAAIQAVKEDDFDRLIDLPEGVLYRDDPQAPARAIIQHLNLGAFVV